ncbi:MAG: hypothetical protein RMY29_028730 [Nostoc sp. CreGUA01]|nr:hypothetical protein [Nostoc sp. CreGUA01]
MLAPRVRHQKLEMVRYGRRLAQRQLLQRIAQRIPFGMLRLERVLERQEPPQRTGSLQILRFFTKSNYDSYIKLDSIAILVMKKNNRVLNLLIYNHKNTDNCSFKDSFSQ